MKNLVRIILSPLLLLVLIVACSKLRPVALNASEAASFQIDGLSLVEWAPDHNGLAVAGAEGVFLYQADANRQELQQLSGVTAAVTSLAFSPNGQHLVAGLKNGNILLWSIGELEPALIIKEHHTAVKLLAISPDSRVLASYVCFLVKGYGEDCDIYLWDIQSGQLLKRLSAETIRAKVLTFTSDGNNVLAGTYNRSSRGFLPNTIRRWDVETGQQASLIGQMDIAFSPNGQIVATGEYLNSSHISLWDPISWTNIDILTVAPGVLQDLTFSHNSTLLAGLSLNNNDEVAVWDVKTGEVLMSLSLTATGPLAFHPCECLLATGNGARAGHGYNDYEVEDTIARIWSVPEGELLVILDGLGERVSDVKFSADGNWIATVSYVGDTVDIWDLKTLVITEQH